MGWSSKLLEETTCSFHRLIVTERIGDTVTEIDVAPLNYERNTVIVNPLRIPIEGSVALSSGSHGTEAVTEKRTNFDLPKGPPFTDKTDTARSSFANTTQSAVLQSAPLTSSGPPTQLNTSNFLNLLSSNENSFSPEFVAGRYETQNASIDGSIDIKG